MKIFLKVILASILMGFALYAGVYLFGFSSMVSQGQKIIALISLISGGIAVFVCLAQLFGVADWRELKSLCDFSKET